MKGIKNTILLMVLSLWVLPAQAAIVSTFTDRTAWEAAVSSTITTVDFETPDASATPGFIVTTPSLTTAEGTTFSVPTGSELFVVSPTLFPAFSSQALFSEQNSSGVQSLDISLAPSFAFGLDLFSIQEISRLDFLLSSGDTSSTTISPSLSFFGLITNTAFNTINLSASLSAGDSMRIDNFSFASPNPIPIPAAIWLFGTALAGVCGFSRHRKAV